MTAAIRMILILILTLIVPLTCGLSAQETATATATATPTDTANPTPAETTTGEATSTAPPLRDVHEIRAEFSRLLRLQPRELAAVFVLDPRLMTNEAFLAGYPDVAAFLAAHPEVAANPRFYLTDFRANTRHESSLMADVLEAGLIFLIFVFIAFVLAWLVRTTIEQKRWNRLSRQQIEVHNKILDRFGSTSEVLEYIKTPAGAKFLEAAPIPLHAEPARPTSPVTRVIWSVQLGVVVAAGALGMLLVSLRLENEAARDLFALGMIGFCVGVGFVASAVVAMILSRRLNAWQENQDSGLVR
ncbi:MAG TPA: hypothetical protein VFT12_00525 [Thermoanaerobaculia bacterium]|nr:hypothetical protein [Thermoanaerobaculia bacterium]